MMDSIYEKYGIDPNRIPTDAEVNLVAYCFDVSESEARSILAQRREQSQSMCNFVNDHETWWDVLTEHSFAQSNQVN